MIAPTLGMRSDGRDNNLNLIRMVLASAVLVSHAVPLSRGIGTPEPLENLLHFSLGGLAVYGFFAISGFLVTQSLMRRGDLGSYASARALRIFPGLAVVLLLTVLVLGPATTTLPFDAYAHAPATWRYFPANVSLLRLQYELPQVFVSNPYPSAINGSLWTLPLEALCYVALGAIWRMGGFRTRARAAATVVLLGVFVVGVAVAGTWIPLPRRLTQFAFLSFCFACGAAFYFGRERIVLHRGWALLGVAAATAINAVLPAPYLFCGAYFYALFAFGYMPAGILAQYNRLGDYSYGTYIYAFPIAQLLAWWRPGIVPWQLCAIGAPLTFAAAALSWHLVEKPMLSFKRWRRA